MSKAPGQKAGAASAAAATAAASSAAAIYTPAFVRQARACDTQWRAFLFSAVPCDSQLQGDGKRSEGGPPQEAAGAGATLPAAPAAKGPAQGFQLVFSEAAQQSRAQALAPLADVMRTGLRQRFQVMTLGDVLQWCVDNAKTFEPCRDVKAALDAAGGNGLAAEAAAPAAVALALKLRLLLLRQDALDARARAEALAAAGGGARAPPGGTAKTRKDASGSDSASADVSASGGVAAGPGSAGGDAASRRRQKLRDRGANPNADFASLSSLQDEPAGGPDLYVLLADFASAEFYNALQEQLATPLAAIVLLDGAVPTRAQREEQLLLEREGIRPPPAVQHAAVRALVKSSAVAQQLFDAQRHAQPASLWRDTAFVSVRASKAQDARELFDLVASAVYQLLDLAEVHAQLLSGTTPVAVPSLELEAEPNALFQRFAALRAQHQVYSYLCDQVLGSDAPSGSCAVDPRVATTVPLLLAAEQAARTSELVELAQGGLAEAQCSGSGGLTAPEVTDGTVETSKAFDAAQTADAEFVVESQLNQLIESLVGVQLPMTSGQVAAAPLPSTLTTGKAADAPQAPDSVNAASAATLVAAYLDSSRAARVLELPERAAALFDHSLAASLVRAYSQTAAKLGDDAAREAALARAAAAVRLCQLPADERPSPAAVDEVLELAEFADLLEKSAASVANVDATIAKYTWAEQLTASELAAVVTELVDAQPRTFWRVSQAHGALLLATAGPRPLSAGAAPASDAWESFVRTQIGFGLYVDLYQRRPELLARLHATDAALAPTYRTIDALVLPHVDRETVYAAGGCSLVETRAGTNEESSSEAPAAVTTARTPAFTATLHAEAQRLVVQAAASQAVLLVQRAGSAALDAAWSTADGVAARVNAADASVAFTVASDGSAPVRHVVLRDGALVSLYDDGRVLVRYATGACASTGAGAAATPVTTHRDGRRITGNGPLAPVPTAVRENRAAGTVEIVREDGCTVLADANSGRHETRWAADGVAMTLQPASGDDSAVVEISHASFGRVRVASGAVSVETPLGFRALLLTDASGACSAVELLDSASGLSLNAAADSGEATASAAIDGVTTAASAYLAVGTLELDINGNRVPTSTEAAKQPAAADGNLPNLFIVRPDGSAAQLVQSDTVKQLTDLWAAQPGARIVEERYNSRRTMLAMLPTAQLGGSAPRATPFYRYIVQREPVVPETLAAARAALAEFAEQQSAFATDRAALESRYAARIAELAADPETAELPSEVALARYFDAERVRAQVAAAVGQSQKRRERPAAKLAPANVPQPLPDSVAPAADPAPVILTTRSVRESLRASARLPSLSARLRSVDSQSVPPYFSSPEGRAFLKASSAGKSIRSSASILSSGGSVRPSTSHRAGSAPQAPLASQAPQVPQVP